MRHIVSSLLLLVVSVAAYGQKINLGPGGNVRGTLQAANCPQLTGDTTATANTCVTTTVKVNGVAYPANPAIGTVPTVTGSNVITYQTVSGLGTVTSVGGTFTGGLISISGSPITTAGTLGFTVAGTSGGVPYFSTSSTWASSGILTANLPVLGGGPGAAPVVGTRTGNTTQFATWTGATTAARCIDTDASGNLQVTAADCGQAGVSSVALTVNATSPSGIFTVTGSPVTATGTLNFNLAGNSGGVPYFSTGTVLSSSSALTANLPVIGGGAGSAPSVGTRTGNTTQFATWTGATTAARCVDTDASGNLKVTAADCGSGGGISGLTTGFIPKAASSSSLGDSLLDDGITTALTLSYSGSGGIATTASGGGQWNALEGNAPSGVAAHDLLWADSIAHRWKMNNNNGGAAQVVASGVDINTSDQVTVTHLSSPLQSSQGGTANAFFTVAGPASSVKTYTFPNANATIGQVIAIGSSALGTSAIASGVCATAITASATGTLTTDTVTASFSSDPTAVTGYSPTSTGMLTIISYPTADNVNFKVCNNTTSSVTPGAITLNWRVAR